MVEPSGIHPVFSAQKQDESEELARFREEWKAEVQRRKQASGATPAGEGSEFQSENGLQQHKTRVARPSTRATAGVHAPSIPTSGSSTAPHPAILANGKIAATTVVSPGLDQALEIYREAVRHEQRGELDAALTRYRTAFRLDPHVDRAFHREEMLASKLQAYTQKAAGVALVPPSTDMPPPDVQQISIKSVATGSGAEDKYTVASGTLAKVAESFPPDTTFEPEDENQPVLLNVLPTEILFSVLRKLDVTSLERFAKVSRRARLLTLDPVYWSELVRKTYKPPQVPGIEDLPPIVHRYNADFRRVFIEHRRVRMDGVYISICHYVRPGLSENSWVNLSHLITYHRYLRFFPNGQVLSLLANEEFGPQQVIPILKPTLRMKGLLIGNWYLADNTLNIVNLMDASGKFLLPEWELPNSSVSTSGLQIHVNRALDRPPAPTEPLTPVIKGGTAFPGPNTSTTHAPGASASHHTHHRHHSQQAHRQHQSNHLTQASATTATPSSTAPAQLRYVFDMSLELRSRPLGRWNKLDILSYDSVNLETGEVNAFPLKNERPFWFSKVRSYAS